eukprot:scaffold133344_cov93-Phaeocystis_antarctica.AAC.2
MALMLMTLDVSKLSGWSNTTAPRNMPLMSVTLDVSKSSCWLNAAAPKLVFDPPNMKLMSVTPEVFQLDTSALKFCKLLKRKLISEMAETSQSAIGP